MRELLLWIGSPLSILGSIAGGFFFNRWGALRVFGLSCLAAVGLCWFSALVSVEIFDVRWGAAVMLGAEKFIFGTMLVMIYSMIMGLSIGRQAATNYAVLCSLNHVVLMGVTPITGFVGELAGYTGLYAGLGLFGILALFAGRYILLHRFK